MARREELGHPLGTIAPSAPLAAPKPASGSLPLTAATFVLEIGTEELPPDDVASGIDQLRSERLGGWAVGRLGGWVVGRLGAHGSHIHPLHSQANL